MIILTVVPTILLAASPNALGAKGAGAGGAGQQNSSSTSRQPKALGIAIPESILLRTDEVIR
jgi:hypothetical protein